MVKAAAYKIDALTLTEATALDWKAKVDTIPGVAVEAFLIPYLTGCTVFLSDEQSTRLFAGGNHQIPCLELFTASGESSGTVRSFAELLLADPNVTRSLQEHAFLNTGTEVEIDLPMTCGSYLMTPDRHRFNVAAIRITAMCQRSVVDSKIMRCRYGNTAVLVSTGECMGHSVQMVFSEAEGSGNLQTSIQVAKVTDKQ